MVQSLGSNEHGIPLSTDTASSLNIADGLVYFSHIYQTPQQTTAADEEIRARLRNFIKRPATIGLQLSKTSSMLELIEQRLGAPPYDHNSYHPLTEKGDHNSYHPLTEKAEKFKAVHFPISLLHIGGFRIVATHEADLVAKCYYAKRKLVWEILDRGLKNKIEIQWQDISAMRASFEENRPGILEVELSQPPTFFHESDPKPRKHTIWKASLDFTGGQASIYRRHYVEFPSGVLDKHYEKLIQCDIRLLQLSQKPFPSAPSPYFQDLHHGVTDFSYVGHNPRQSQTYKATQQLQQPLSAATQQPQQPLRCASQQRQQPLSCASPQPQQPLWCGSQQPQQPLWCGSQQPKQPLSCGSQQPQQPLSCGSQRQPQQPLSCGSQRQPQQPLSCSSQRQPQQPLSCGSQQPQQPLLCGSQQLQQPPSFASQQLQQPPSFASQQPQQPPSFASQQPQQPLWFAGQQLQQPLSCIPAPVVSTQRVQQFGNAIPSSLVISDSASPTSVIDIYSANHGIINNQTLRDPTLPFWSQGLHDYENLFAMDSMQSASDVELHRTGLSFTNFSNVEMLLTDSDSETLSSLSAFSTAFNGLRTEVDPTYSNNTSTQIDWSFRGENSWNALTVSTQEQYPASNANVKHMYGELSDEGTLTYTQSQPLHYVPPLQVFNENLGTRVPDPLQVFNENLETSVPDPLQVFHENLDTRVPNTLYSRVNPEWSGQHNDYHG